MEVAKILTADVLDIIFEGRNKTYGAYELRRTYRRRMLISLTATGTFIFLFVGSYLLANRPGELNVKQLIIPEDQKLAKIETEHEPPPPPPPPKAPEPPKQIEMKKFMTIKIVDDKDVKPDEKPPVNDDLEDVKIGNANVDGVKDDHIEAPPSSDALGKGIIEAPKKPEPDEPFMKVEKESEYPGGKNAWERYLNKSLRYPQEAQDNEIQGTVLIQFVVDKEGNVSDVEALSGPEELRAEAIRVIRKSGKWNPALQNGIYVKSYKKQPIGFKLNVE